MDALSTSVGSAIDLRFCSLCLIDPSWYVFPGFTGFVMQTFVVGLHQPQSVPEPTRVVHNLRVAQLVAEDITHEPLGEKKQFVVDADRPVSRTTGPSGPLSLHQQSINQQTALIAQSL